MSRPSIQGVDWRVRFIRWFAIATLVTSIAALAATCVAVVRAVDFVDELTSEVDFRMAQADASLLEVESAIGPYDIFASDLSKRAIQELRALVRTVKENELTKMMVPVDTLAEVDQVTKGWKQALSSRVPAQELVDLRAELAQWRARVQELRDQLCFVLYAGLAAFCLLVGALAFCCILILRAYPPQARALRTRLDAL